MSYSVNAFLPIEGYRLAFNGTRGRLEVRDYERQPWPVTEETEIALIKNFGQRTPVDIPKAEGGHGGGDIRLRDLIFRQVDAKAAVYVGEAESIRDRLRGHLDKDWWNYVVFFISKDENLTKAHIRYLEGRLIEQAKSAGRALVMNGQSSGAKLPESDREDMEIFLERIHQLMPVLGADALLPIGSTPAGSAQEQILVCEIKGLKATGHLIPTGFVVLKGSQAVLKERASAHQYPYTLASRKKLIEDGTLVKDGERLYSVVTQSSALPVRRRLSCTEAPQMDCWRGRPGMGRRSRSSKPSNNRLEPTRSARAWNRGPRSSSGCHTD